MRMCTKHGMSVAVHWDELHDHLCPLCRKENDVAAMIVRSKSHRDKLTIANAKLAAIAEAEERERERLAAVGEDATKPRMYSDSAGHGFNWAVDQILRGRTVRRLVWNTREAGICSHAGAPAWRLAHHPHVGRWQMRDMEATDWIIDPAAEQPDGRDA